MEIQRTVNAVGTVSIAGKFHSVGQQFAGRRITLRLETTLAHVVLDGVLTRTIPLTLTQRARLQGARMPGPAPQPDQHPARVQRTVSCRGGTQIIGQRIQVGLRYAGQIVTIEVDETTLRLYDHHDHLIKHVPRTCSPAACNWSPSWCWNTPACAGPWPLTGLGRDPAATAARRRPCAEVPAHVGDAES